MTHRLAVIFSLAITLLLAGGVYAGRDRLMPARGAETAPVTVTTGTTADQPAEPVNDPLLGQSALPPLSPRERAETTRSLLPVSGSRTERDGSINGGAARRGDDEDDDDDHEDHEDHEDEEDDDD